MSYDSRKIVVDPGHELEARRQGCDRRVAHQIGDIDFRRWTFRQASECREASRDSLQASSFYCQHLYRFLQARRCQSP